MIIQHSAIFLALRLPHSRRSVISTSRQPPEKTRLRFASGGLSFHVYAISRSVSTLFFPQTSHGVAEGRAKVATGFAAVRYYEIASTSWFIGAARRFFETDITEASLPSALQGNARGPFASQTRNSHFVASRGSRATPHLHDQSFSSAVAPLARARFADAVLRYVDVALS